MTLAERVYRRFPTLLIARRNLTRTTTRTALATLGVVIGVVAIASLGVLGTTLQVAALGSLGDIGNQLVVSPNAEAGVESLSDRDVGDIRRIAGDGTVIPLKRTDVTLEYANRRTVTLAYGIENPDAAYNASEGTIPTPLRSGVLVGADLADRLDVRAGSSLVVDNRTYRVRAIVAEQPAFSPVSPNNAVVVPATDVNLTGYSQVIVNAENGRAANETAMEIRERVNSREERVTVFELRRITEQINSFFRVLNLFLVGTGSVSLLVAGISILNVMLMSTIERREEIGIMRAVGYQRRDVLGIVLAEAGLLGVLGGAIGALISLGVGALVSHLALQAAVRALAPRNVAFIGLAFAFGVVTSILGGLYPAWKAARERPVESLRD